MKKIFITYVVLLYTTCACAMTTDTDSLLQAEYRAGHSNVMQIIQDEGLTDEIRGHAFYALLLGKMWMIVVKRDDCFDVFCQGSLYKRKQYNFPQQKRWNLPFSLLSQKEKDKRRFYDEEYHPLYVYFVLLDASHNICYEWNNSTKVHHKEKRIKKILRQNISFLTETAIQK